MSQINIALQSRFIKDIKCIFWIIIYSDIFPVLNLTMLTLCDIINDGVIFTAIVYDMIAYDFVAFSFKFQAKSCHDRLTVNWLPVW